jgi:signal transduction histidine kinase
MTSLAAATYRMTSRQKWQLALSVFVVYWPVRLYVNLAGAPSFVWVRSIPVFLMEILLSVAFFFLWLSVTEWIQARLSDWFGDGFLIEFKIPAQLLTLLIAGVLAVIFNIAFHILRHSLNEALAAQFAFYREWPQPPTPRGGGGPRFDPALRTRVNNGLTVLAMLAGFYLAANRRAYKRLGEVEVKAERLEKASAQAQFAALKNQVSPHFLFNSLSILSSLVQVDADLSEKFIDQLSRAYRYILEQKDNELVTLKTELEFIQAYVFLLKIRFESKFDVSINVPETLWTQYKIAPLTLQLLVENVVKHNQMSSDRPLRVQIRVEKDNLVVENVLQPREQTEASSTGVGLQNIVNRYALLTPRPVTVGPDEGMFVVKIPLLT